MEKILFNLGAELDRIRSWFLRLSLSNAFLRELFCVRAYRLAALFSFSLLLSLTTSLIAPLWVLILGPMIYGTPHLFASLRYVGKAAGESSSPRKKSFKTTVSIFSGIFALVSLVRIFTDFNLLPLQSMSGSDNWIEIISYVLTLGFCAFYFGRSVGHIICSVLLGMVFVWSAWSLPLWTTGALLLLHNFIAFIYWIAATQSKRERIVAIFATLLFLVANVLIFSGLFDGIYKVFSPAAEISWAELDYSQLGKMILPWSSNYVLWFHAVVAYAFGQSLHYFIWMKAIPDQNHDHEVPTSFRQSFRLLKNDFRGGHFLFLLLVVLASIAVWVFLRVPQARIVYFALAAYHGYLEIAGLSFIRFRKLA